MKKYCIKPQAKETIINILVVVFIKLPLIIIIAMSILGLLSLIIILARGYPKDTFELVLGSLGVLSWTGILAYIGLSSKRWIQLNIVEC